MRNIWRWQPSLRLLRRNLLKSSVGSAGQFVAASFFETKGTAGNSVSAYALTGSAAAKASVSAASSVVLSYAGAATGAVDVSANSSAQFGFIATAAATVVGSGIAADTGETLAFTGGAAAAVAVTAVSGAVLSWTGQGDAIGEATQVNGGAGGSRRRFYTYNAPDPEPAAVIRRPTVAVAISKVAPPRPANDDEDDEIYLLLVA